MPQGVAPWYEVLGGLFRILVLNQHRPLELGLLGTLEPSRHRAGRTTRTRSRPKLMVLFMGGAARDEHGALLAGQEV